MSSAKDRINYITTAAFIAAVYTALTYLGGFFGISYGPVQIRFSEALCILPVFTPAAISGLTVGCFLANVGSFNLLDMIFGTSATLIAAVLTYYLRNIRFKRLPLLALLPPVVINALIIGAEISIFFLPQEAFFYGFIISALEIGLGQLIACYGLGLPLYFILKSRRILNYNLFNQRK